MDKFKREVSPPKQFALKLTKIRGTRLKSKISKLSDTKAPV